MKNQRNSYSTEERPQRSPGWPGWRGHWGGGVKWCVWRAASEALAWKMLLCFYSVVSLLGTGPKEISRDVEKRFMYRAVSHGRVIIGEMKTI